MKEKRKKWKKRGWIAAVLSIFMMCSFFAGSSVIFAEEDEPVRGTHDNVITEISALLQDGSGPVDTISQWQVFRLNASFELPDGEVKSGDTTTIKLPEKLRFDQTLPFEIRDTEGNLIANASVNGSDKTLTLTYTDYPESHSGVNGQFFFYVKVDREKVDGAEDIPLEFVVDGQIIFGGSVHFIGIPTPTGQILVKSGTQQASINGRVAWFDININTKQVDLENVQIIDRVQSPQITIDKSSLSIRKGHWEANHGDWYFLDGVNVTDQFEVKWDPDSAGFTVDLGDVSSTEGYSIRYYVVSPYELVDGETIDNRAILKAKGQSELDSDASVTFAFAGGSGAGYVYEIHVKKIDRDGNLLAGAEFDVIRMSNGETVGTITTDASGEGTVGRLLKDRYMIVERSAPVGYKLLEEPIYVEASEFGSGNVAEAVIENEAESIDIPVEKKWIGPPSEKATAVLFADDVETDRIDLTADNSWAHTFQGLAKYDTGDGHEIAYTVEEVPIQGYTPVITGSAEEGFIIENTNTETLAIPVEKKWVGKEKDSISVNLYADGVLSESVKINAENGWKHTFENLPVYTEEGETIRYVISEDPINGYKTEIQGDEKNGYVITNTEEPSDEEPPTEVPPTEEPPTQEPSHPSEKPTGPDSPGGETEKPEVPSDEIDTPDDSGEKNSSSGSSEPSHKNEKGKKTAASTGDTIGILITCIVAFLAAVFGGMVLLIRRRG